MSLSVWLISLSIMPSKFIHIITKYPPFLWLCSITCIYTPHHLYPFIIDGHTGCFMCWKLLLGTLESMFLFKFVFLFFFRYTPKSGIAGSCGSSIFSFWETSMLFSIVAAPVNIPTNSAWEFSAHPHHRLLFFLMMVILRGVRWYFIAILIYISLRKCRWPVGTRKDPQCHT